MSTTDPREPQQRSSGASSEPAATSGASSTTPSANRASSPAASTASSTSTGSTPTTLRPRTSGGGGGGGAALGIAALVLGLVLGAFGMQLIDNGGDDSDSGGNALVGNVDEARFQAVILTNDKVYFGRLSEVNDTFFRLDDAFFLRETRESPEAEPVRALLPINRELHAPENSILIRQDEVVLVENLDEESPLLEEIERQTGESGSEPPTSDSGER